MESLLRDILDLLLYEDSFVHQLRLINEKGLPIQFNEIGILNYVLP